MIPQSSTPKPNFVSKAIKTLCCTKPFACHLSKSRFRKKVSQQKKKDLRIPRENLSKSGNSKLFTRLNFLSCRSSQSTGIFKDEQGTKSSSLNHDMTLEKNDPWNEVGEMSEVWIFVSRQTTYNSEHGF